jgi:hypothetical protein
VLARGWCSRHYARWRRTGSPLGRVTPTFEELLALRTDIGDCWLWTGAHVSSGYGNLKVASVNRPAHVWVWENLVGPVPDGLELDHLCRVRACVNPDHLEPVTRAVNLRRSWAIRVRHGWRIDCKGQAHALSGTQH